MALDYPLIAWGSAEDITAAPWVDLNTPLLTGGQADPFGDTGAVLVDDDNPGASEARSKPIGLLPTGRATVFPMARAGSAAVSSFLVVDVDAGFVGRLQLHWTWSGGVPTLSIITGGANATLHGVIALGSGWYGALATITGLIPGNQHQIRCYGAVPGTSPTQVGSTYWYIRNVVLLDAPKEATAWEDPRAGSEFVEGPDGGCESWITGWDQKFVAEFDRIPPQPRSSPAVISGWDGSNESVGVNAGVAAMLAAGRKRQSLIFVPDRANCAANIPSDLLGPLSGKPSTDAIWDRRIRLELKNPTTMYPLSV